MNCQIYPNTSPPIRLGIKNPALKISLNLILLDTSKAKPNDTKFTTTTLNNAKITVIINEYWKRVSAKLSVKFFNPTKLILV